MLLKNSPYSSCGTHLCSLFVYSFIHLFSYFPHDYFLVQKKTGISDNHVSGYSRHGGTLM